MTSQMRIEERRVADVTILRLVGRLELEAGDFTLRDCVNGLVDQGHVKILLDMSDLTRLDSAGIGMLVSKYLTARRRGGAIKLLRLTNRTGHLMDVTRLSSVFEIFEDEGEALRSFGLAPAAGA